MEGAGAFVVDYGFQLKLKTAAQTATHGLSVEYYGKSLPIVIAVPPWTRAGAW